ncbi:hypothetical protein SAMD00079811_51350 [Scytonema sp. HK-05]|uniref:hypothetical protein n=1 Tax=Scytonema sp. HK-05 TaxID=1137095 RepID=UPI000AFE74FB|nr:hypothetical protein [Scytonema sp. HK-05]BAY47517.1 hypothetical protein SAMD00079811_51350 [Scytonema sp. HK-05]
MPSARLRRTPLALLGETPRPQWLTTNAFDPIGGGLNPEDETDNPSGMPSARLCPMPAARQGRTDTRSERRTPVAVRAGDPPKGAGSLITDN